MGIRRKIGLAYGSDCWGYGWALSPRPNRLKNLVASWQDAGLKFATMSRTDGTSPPAYEYMDEKQFYVERQETKNLPLVCPHCRQENTYAIRWIVRNKKKELPRGAGEEDRKHFAQARSYMVRVDELVACRNIRCRKRFELTGQSVVLVSDAGGPPSGNFDPETFGNR